MKNIIKLLILKHDGYISISYFQGNTEKYILRFLISIQNQFFENIEIILVDDFSLDN